MRIEKLTDQWAAVARLLDGDTTGVRESLASEPDVVGRWIAFDRDEPAGLVTAWTRADGRTFLRFRCRDDRAHRPLAEAAKDSGIALSATFLEGQSAAIDGLLAVGFVEELRTERFRIGFTRALDLLRRASVPNRYRLVPADQVDRDVLFTLDIELRGNVPGNDGWRGNREWFDEEMQDDAFVPEAYPVAVDGEGIPIGLARVWRNQDGPHFGMVGLLPDHRGTLLAPALLRRALEVAADWGHDTFTADTSPSNRGVFRAVNRAGAESLARRRRLVWRPGR